ncbi:hypothetical protein [Mesorhizobium sp.]|uniref:hypothetical protein n=1 Tax=Mesorhizobium sp. TaxID=1871066 RepID=UPI000FE4D338|nr:hypothetical protein [Mesorhizobium sp.]RWD33038.1 MAG: hypothetical protein EOS34_20195 [Mesorhizobium sp.]RWD77240.1 MAG: hypothetical protein EOS48_29535 [Mesorhizobium sp.]RWE61130.1 MAG: hypothetical protein EOS67_05300 [Mesorhizobium sp.]RWE93791.1 MAG: hypothetical protein EOS43_28250 [Mesorhizobium sp.]TIS34635.1 MAG: hypothetical protein E5W95_29090 [Mesorhizobium sp.]
MTRHTDAFSGERPVAAAPSRRQAISIAAIGLAIAATDLAGLAPLSFVGEAQARIGQPLTPGSVAGVTRRTTRRVLRHTAVYVAALPTGCVRTNVDGFTVWRCGTTYYRRYHGRYVVVRVD